MKELIKKINALAKKEKTQGLSDEEKREQKKLREQYLNAFRGNFKKTLMNVKVVDPLGNDITPEKLVREQNKRKN